MGRCLSSPTRSNVPSRQSSNTVSNRCEQYQSATGCRLLLTVQLLTLFKTVANSALQPFVSTQVSATTPGVVRILLTARANPSGHEGAAVRPLFIVCDQVQSGALTSFETAVR